MVNRTSLIKGRYRTWNYPEEEKKSFLGIFHPLNLLRSATKLTEKDGPRLSGKEVSLKDESLQRGVLHEKVKPKKKEVDLKKAR
ncbi:MAG: hypothetical protein LKM40_03780 [Mageeibacillus sp.]|jgi:hypothetical protein|nr:hypothetical protein [Mageeibacillus sp.]